MIRERIKKAREAMAAELVAHGSDQAAAAEAVGKIGDGQILAWLMLHGPDIAALIRKLFGL